MNRDAMVVLDRLIQEDDQSVEAWYLGGWCQHLMVDNHQATNLVDKASAMDDSAETVAPDSTSNLQVPPETLLRGSRRWLRMSLKLYAQQDYEDDRLLEHAQELVAGLDKVLGTAQDDDEAGEDAEWEDWDGIDAENGDEDHEDHDTQMEDA